MKNVLCAFGVFFFKQKTAYEMRISDWSSDVCSSDLRTAIDGDRGLAAAALRVGIEILGVALSAGPRTAAGDGSASLARPMTAVRVAFIKLRALVLRIILRADHADIVAVLDLLGLQRPRRRSGAALLRVGTGIAE